MRSSLHLLSKLTFLSDRRRLELFPPFFLMRYVREDGKVCTEIKNSVAIRPQGYLAQHE